MDLVEGKRSGGTFNDARDGDRLNRQARAVFDLMRDGRWRTLQAISDRTGEPEASVSARLRDLRKPRFGSFVVDRRYITAGIWEYRVHAGEAQL